MRGSVLFNEDEVKHAGQQQSKKHKESSAGQTEQMKLMIRSPVQHTQRSVPSSPAARRNFRAEMQLPVARSKFAVCRLKLFCSS